MSLVVRLLLRLAPLAAIAIAFRLVLEPVLLALAAGRPPSVESRAVLPVVLVLGFTALVTFLLRRAHRAPSSDAPVHTVIAAHRLARRASLGLAAIGLVSLGAEAALQVAGGTAPSIALPSAALGVAEVALLSLGTYVLVRRAARPFVSSISPEFVPAGRSSIRTKLVLAIAVPVASTAVVATVVVFRHADETAREADRALAHELAALGTLRREPPTAPVRPWALAVALCGATAVAAGLGIGAGSRAAREIVQTARSIDRLVDRRSAEATAHAPLFVELAHLSEAVDALSRRYEEIEATTESALAAREQAQRMKTQFLASMSHDLRSPLNSIIGFSELLLRGVEGPLAPSQRENVEIIKRSGEDLLRLINDILDSARIEADRIDLVRRWTPSVSLVSDTIRRARELIGEKDVELHSELQPGLPPIYVDVDRLAQALFNLLSNAVKFMSSGTIWVRAHVSEGPPGPPGQYLRIEVADTGQGIPEEHRESIFEAFRQLDAGSTRRAGGMGLGLSLAKNLVELHGGRIWLESRIGEGSVFYVAIPLTGEG